MSDGGPHLASNFPSVLMNESVSNDQATSRCTALVTKHVKRHPLHFSCLHKCLIMSGPKKSTPTFEKDGATCNRSFGRLVIKGGCGLTHLLLHTEQSLRTFLTVDWECGIQYSNLDLFWTCSVPSWLSFLWQSMITRWHSWWSWGMIVGCLGS